MTKVLICSVIKDVAHRIVSNIERAHTFGQYFPYKILLYENNSTDTTKQALATLSSHPHIKVIMETLSYTKDTSKVWAYTKITQSDHPCRIEQIANARNQLVHELNHPQYDDYDVVVWIDMDAEDFDIPSIVDSIHQVQQKNIVLFANSPAYYDYYALRCHNFQCTNLFGPELIGDIFWNIHAIYPIHFQNTDLFEVYSAFNGIGVYPKKIFQKHKYDCMITPEVQTLYKQLIANTASIPPYIKNAIQNPCSNFPGGIVDNDQTIIWKCNSGYDQPVVCEHVVLHFSLILDGYKLYINPQMKFVR